MVHQSELDRLRSAWRALAGESKGEGWRTIPIRPTGPRQLLAGRHFPGNEEAILVGIKPVHVPPDGQLPQGQGFRVEQIKRGISGDADAWIALSRQQAGNLDMFTRMTEDIIGMLETYEYVDDQMLFQLFLGRIRAWQDFMHQARAEVLAPEAEVGLVGELCFLKLLLERGLPAAMILDSWRGPLGGLHDFLLGSGAVEVKSTVSACGFPATAGSLEQFDVSLVSPLLLVGVRFMLDVGGMTLPALVDDIVCRLGDLPDVKETFESLVLRGGFLRAFSDRYTRRFSHCDTKIMLVDREFPALTRVNVHPAIRKARYELDLDLIAAPNLGMDRVIEELGVTM